MSLYQSDVQIQKKLEKTEKEFQNKMRKNKSSDKKKSFDKKQFWKYKKNWKISIEFQSSDFVNNDEVRLKMNLEFIYQEKNSDIWLNLNS